MAALAKLSHRANWHKLACSFDTALTTLPGLLKDAGFGVVTHTKIEEVFKEKLGVEFQRYHIIGVCNPRIAHAVLSADPTAGILLPCPLVLTEQPGGSVTLGVIDPALQLDVSADAAPELIALAADVGKRLGSFAAAMEALA